MFGANKLSRNETAFGSVIMPIKVQKTLEVVITVLQPTN